MLEPRSVIRAPRLDLVLMSPELIRSILGANWAAVDRVLEARVPAEWQAANWQWLRTRAAWAEVEPAAIPWLPRVQCVRMETGRDKPRLVVGDAGFHGPPDEEGRVEIGYSVVSEHRRRGYAEEAVRALMAWAASEYGVTRFRACIDPSNVPSLSLIRKLGFVQVGAHDGHDGGDLVFHRDGLPSSRMDQ